jgi:hypothetical protein
MTTKPALLILGGINESIRLFFYRVTFVVGNGQVTRFSQDTWLGDTPLAMQYPLLCNIV